MNDSAAERVAALAARNRHAAELARYASLAVRIDTPLLRRLRLALLPGADASAEADFWFSTLSESRGDEGLVLDAEVASLLRERLAAEQLVDGTRALDIAWRHTAALHESWPASLQLEERLTYLALADGANAGPQIEEALQPAMVAMASGEQRALEVARWAVRAVPRLPAVARDSDAAVALALAAMAVLDSGGNAVAATGAQAMPANLGWLLPLKVFATRAKLACEVSARGLRLRAARSEDPPDMTIELPLTRPLMVELRWSVDGQQASRLHSIQPGATVPLPEGWRQLRLRALDGAAWAIEPMAPASAAGDMRGLMRACLRVTCGKTEASGVQVAPGSVLTTLDAVREAREAPSHVAQDVVLRQGSRLFPARLALADTRVGLALLATEPLPNVETMPRAPHDGKPGDIVTLLAHAQTPDAPVQTSARIAVVEMSATLDGQHHEHLIQLQLDSGWPPAQPDRLAGTPVMLGGAMAGMVGWRGNRELYAIPGRTIDRFLGWAMRPGEHFPDILFSYAPDDDYGKGREIDGESVGRIQRALSDARLRSWFTEDMQRSPESELGLAFNRAEGAVCLFTPVASGRGEAAERELAAIAFRLWADPHFPVALATFRAQVPPLPTPLQSLEPLVVDAMDDDALWQQLQDRLDSEAARQPPRPSEEAFHAAVASRFSLPPDTVVDAAVFDRLVEQVISAASLAPPGHPEAVADAELAAMAALPAGDTLRRLRQAAEARPGRRGVALNAMPVQYARLLLRKAWYPSAPPPHVVIRDQQWPEDVGPLVAQVVQQVAEALAAPEAAAVGWVLANAEAAYAVIFATRPFPGPRIVGALHAVLPGAVLFFLGTESVDPEQAAMSNLVVLPPLPDGRVSLEWIQRYKRMMDTVAPRDGRRGGSKANRKSAA